MYSVINNSVYNQWYYAGCPSTEVGVVMAPMSHDGLVTVDNGGCVRQWQTALFYLDQSLKQWRGLIGEGEKELKVGQTSSVIDNVYIVKLNIDNLE